MISNQQSQKIRYPFQKSWRWKFVQLFDFLCDRFYKSPKNTSFPNLARNILIIRLDQIGDLVCTLPVFPVLRMRYPNARITVLTSKEGLAIFKGNPFVDHVIVFESNWFSKSKIVNFKELFEILSQLKKMNYDLGFDLRGDLRNILLMAFVKVRYRVGYGIAGGGNLLHRICDYQPDLHQVELNIQLVTDEKIGKHYLKPDLYLTPEERREGLELLKSAGVKERHQLIAIHPEAGYVSKEWERAKFKELIQKLIANSEHTVLILGLSKAAELASEFNSPQVINLTGKLSLREMIAVLSWCHLFIGNDSGPSHIAQALGIPSTVIASGTNEYDKWGIWREPVRIAKHEVACSPCHLKECKVEGHPCMSEINTDQVFQFGEELLTSAASLK